MLLISGGIDSPVIAGHMIAKRGVQISAVHFYSYPYTSERARKSLWNSRAYWQATRAR